MFNSKIFSSANAFAALKEDGSVVTWGHEDYGGDSSSVSSDISSPVTQIFTDERAFAALKDDGSVVTWGNSGYGSDSSLVSSDLSSGVTMIFSTTRAFAALKDDGSVITWGDSGYGGDISTYERNKIILNSLSGVEQKKRKARYVSCIKLLNLIYNIYSKF